MRETRSYGSVRGVRSNPYPYRDPTPSPCEARLFGRSPLTTGNRRQPEAPNARESPLCGPPERHGGPSPHGQDRPQQSHRQLKERLSAVEFHTQPARPCHPPTR